MVLLLMSVTGVAAQSLWDDPAFALYRQGVEAFNRKEYDRAESLAREAIAQYPAHLLAYYLLGQAALAQSKWDEARQAFSKVVGLYPQSFAGHRELGVALAQLNRFDEAIAAYQHALKLRPAVEEIQTRLAFLYLQASKPDPALPLLKGLTERGTKEPEVWYALGRLYYDRNELAQSEKAFSQAAALHDDGKTWFNLGVVRLRLEDQPGALAAFEQAARDPQTKEQATREIAKIQAQRKAPEPPRRGTPPSRQP
jgi:tetratricopeptide (TPR) repeat protein